MDSLNNCSCLGFSSRHRSCSHNCSYLGFSWDIVFVNEFWLPYFIAQYKLFSIKCSTYQENKTFVSMSISLSNSKVKTVTDKFRLSQHIYSALSNTKEENELILNQLGAWTVASAKMVAFRPEFFRAHHFKSWLFWQQNSKRRRRKMHWW